MLIHAFAGEVLDRDRRSSRCASALERELLRAARAAISREDGMQR